MQWKLNEHELVKFKEWNEKHLSERHKGKEPYAGCIGGRLTFSVTGTSLGDITSVKCVLCGTEENLTDWDNFG